MKKYQFVKWFPRWQGFGKADPLKHLPWAYDWCFMFGFWEIRKWREWDDVERYRG